MTNLNSKIEWTDTTWNVVTGCTKVSPGCDICYAERITERFHGKGSFAEIKLHHDRLSDPLRWRKTRRVFANSMSDLFHKDVPDEFIARVFAVMSATPQHTYQVLTKRHGRMRSLLTNPDFRRAVLIEAVALDEGGNSQGIEPPGWWPLSNFWLGVSVEDQQRAELRIPALLDTPAAIRFLSCEPLLGAVDLSPWLAGQRWSSTARDSDGYGVSSITVDPAPIGWVIAGGESGPNARPMHPIWARDLRDQCQRAEVPFFFKQWGEWGPAPWRVDRKPEETVEHYKARSEAECATHAYAVWAHQYGWVPHKPDHKPWSIERTSLDEAEQAAMRRWGKKTAGRLLDGRTWDEFPGMAVMA